jgi:hypothetical protein
VSRAGRHSELKCRMKATVKDHLALYFATSFSMNTNKKTEGIILLASLTAWRETPFGVRLFSLFYCND